MKTLFSLFGWYVGVRKRNVPQFLSDVEYSFVLNNLPDKKLKILDIGCSESKLGLMMSSLGYKVFGIDLNEPIFRHPNFTFIKGDIMKMPFEDKSFDLVVSNTVIELIGWGWYKNNPTKANGDLIAMHETKRVLKDDGILILTTMYGTDTREKKTGGIDYKTYDKKAFTELMEGWKIIKIKYFYRDTDDFWKEGTEEQVAGMKNAPYSHGIVLCVAIKMKS